jgi:hypothetical protein
MNNSFYMDMEDMLRMKDAEIRSLQEELVLERGRTEAAVREADEAYQQMMRVTRANARLRQQIDSWTQEADQKAAHEEQLQRQGYEL